MTKILNSVDRFNRLDTGYSTVRQRNRKMKGCSDSRIPIEVLIGIKIHIPTHNKIAKHQRQRLDNSREKSQVTSKLQLKD